MKLTNLNTIPVKGLREVFNSSYTFITIVLKNGARVELTQSRRSSSIVLAELKAKIKGVVTSIRLDNGDELLDWFENTLEYQHEVDYTDPVKEASLELYSNMKEWLE